MICFEILLVIFSIVKTLLIISPAIYVHYHILASKNPSIIFLDIFFICLSFIDYKLFVITMIFGLLSIFIQIVQIILSPIVLKLKKLF